MSDKTEINHHQGSTTFLIPVQTRQQISWHPPCRQELEKRLKELDPKYREARTAVKQALGLL